MNLLVIDNLENYPKCESCGSEFLTQHDINELIYHRTTASHDIYYCPDCKKESVFISNNE
jgi:Zn finger protein HypA/HybF involved in hydrogenase expression